ncbi:MAG TPA: LytTR family DNA-binding domain-containing protein [Bacteroidia bacterium]|jgi:two-component system LytT family response regulator|nr:LytTR family DNA-binding domain-containing protein [Bacteroidia bacterium]
MLLKCAIIDDDSLFTQVIEHYLSSIDVIQLMGVYHSPSEALTQINFNEIDFLFLDMEMPGMDGITFLTSLTVVPPIVVVSGKKTYGVDAFEHNALDYLYKPVSNARFLKSVNKIKAHFEKNKTTETSIQQNIFIKHEGIHLRLAISDIFIIRANDNDVTLVANGKSYKTHLRLKDIYEMLPQNEFMQVHRSFIVQLSKIDKVDGEVIEINGRTIPVSRTYLGELYERLRIK